MHYPNTCLDGLTDINSLTGPEWVGASPVLHLRMETDLVADTLRCIPNTMDKAETPSNTKLLYGIYLIVTYNFYQNHFLILWIFT
jgi:hypothetical protein